MMDLAVNHSGDAGGDGVVVAHRRAAGTDGRRAARHRVEGSEGAHHSGSCGRRGVIARPARVASGGRVGIVTAAAAVGRVGRGAGTSASRRWWSVESGHGAGTKEAERGGAVRRHEMPERSARRHPQFLQLGLLEPLGFSASVLEPDFHLGLCQRERSREFGPLGDGQVLLLPKLLLEGHQLLGGERRSRLAVGLVLAQLAAELTTRRQFGQTVQVVVVVVVIEALMVKTGWQFAQIRSIF